MTTDEDDDTASAGKTLQHAAERVQPATAGATPLVNNIDYQQKQMIRALICEGYLQLNPCAQRIAYCFGYIAAVDAGTITISL